MIRDHARLHLPSFLVQVLATAVGLLLALGLDQWKERRHQATLAGAHLAAIQAELRADDREIAREIKSLRTLDAALDEFTHVLRQREPLALNTNLSFSIATLRQSAWDMAVAGQTPLRTDLERMARLADAYEAVRVLRGMNDQLLREMDLLGEIATLLRTKPDLSGVERSSLFNRIQSLRSRMTILQATAPSFQDSIAKALAP